MRQQLEILVVTSVDVDDPVPSLEDQLRTIITNVCDDVLGFDSVERVQFEYGGTE